MLLEKFCVWLEAQPFAKAIVESLWLFPTIESIHVVAITIVVGSIAMIDLRLLGIRKDSRVTSLMTYVLPFTWSAFVVAALSGVLLFSSQATHYFGNEPFRIKVMLLVLAGINMAVFHLLPYKKVASWDNAHTPPIAARFAGGISLFTWVLVVFFGRWIAFV